MALDLKSAEGREEFMRLVLRSDALMEGFRPGVMERLGLGPRECLAHNPRLVYGRMTGWGQHGPMRDRAGHDLNYLGLTGALHAMGHADRPPSPPLNLVADFGGGSLYLVLGIVSALLQRERSGRGAVVDAAMVDGVNSLASLFHAWRAAGDWHPQRESNLLDGGAHFYRVYECSDGRFVAVAPIEPQFYAEMLRRLDLDPAEWPQYDRSRWPELRDRLAAVFAGRTRDEWAAVFADGDACVTPVNSFDEALRDPHLSARGSFVEGRSGPRPAPAPRLESL